MPHKPKMSKFALDRCRRLVITDASTKPGEFRVLMEVFDPRVPHSRPVNSTFARTRVDFRRIQISLCRRYRIPGENIKDTRVEPVTEPKADTSLA